MTRAVNSSLTSFASSDSQLHGAECEDVLYSRGTQLASDDTVFVFDSFRFLPRRQLLLQAGRPVKLGCRAMDILHVLLSNAGDLVSKRALFRFVWPDTFVSDSNLKVHVHGLRRVLGDTSPHPTYIATVAGRGYRFVRPVSVEPVVPIALASAMSPRAQQLPAQTPLIGRSSDIRRVTTLLGERRLVTLTGPAGVGKTAMGITVAHLSRRNFSDGVYFVDLTAAAASSAVPGVIAAACGITTDVLDPARSIAMALSDRRALIVLDNCEHVLAGVAEIAARLQSECVTACLLATSLKPLRVDGEQVFAIEPLEFPWASGALKLSEATQYPAFELFARRAMERANYRVADEDVVAVATLCKKLGGLPRAIELAAAGLDRHSPASLLESLDRR